MLLQEKYRKELRPRLGHNLKLMNVLAVPRPEKVVVNIGCGRTHDQKDHESIIKILTLITGQKPIPRPARVAIASFKTRQGLVIGYKVTLRGKRMWDFLERLVHIVLPRVRDFQGLKISSVDQSGNLTIGIKEHIVFPEISNEDIRHIVGLEVTIVTNARKREHAIALFKSLGFPLVEAEK